MGHVLTLCRRELAAYFLGPMAFLVLLAFQGIAALNFWDLVNSLARNPLALSGARDPLNGYVVGSTPFWLAVLVAVPALTMRLLAEERRSGTLETLLTAPVTEGEVVVAKWLAGVAMYAAFLAPFALYLPFLYYQAGYHFDPGPILAMGIGLLSLGMMLISVGLFFSAITRNQVIAAIATFAALFVLILASAVVADLGAIRRASWAESAAAVSVLNQMTAFGSGRLDLRSLAIHQSITVLMLYLATKVVQYRREG